MKENNWNNVPDLKDVYDKLIELKKSNMIIIHKGGINKNVNLK